MTNFEEQTAVCRLSRDYTVRQLRAMNNIIRHKSGSNEYKDKQINVTKLTLSSTYINRNIMVNHVSERVYKLSYQPNCTRLKNLVFNLLNQTLGNSNLKI